MSHMNDTCEGLLELNLIMRLKKKFNADTIIVY